MPREQPLIGLRVAAMLVQGAVLGDLCPFRRRPDRHPNLGGIRFDLIVGPMT